MYGPILYYSFQPFLLFENVKYNVYEIKEGLHNPFPRIYLSLYQ